MNDFWDIVKVITGNKQFCDDTNKIYFIQDLYSAYKVC